MEAGATEKQWHGAAPKGDSGWGSWWGGGPHWNASKAKAAPQGGGSSSSCRESNQAASTPQQRVLNPWDQSGDARPDQWWSSGPSSGSSSGSRRNRSVPAARGQDQNDWEARCGESEKWRAQGWSATWRPGPDWQGASGSDWHYNVGSGSGSNGQWENQRSSWDSSSRQWQSPCNEPKAWEAKQRPAWSPPESTSASAFSSSCRVQSAPPIKADKEESLKNRSNAQRVSDGDCAAGPVEGGFVRRRLSASREPQQQGQAVALMENISLLGQAAGGRVWRAGGLPDAKENEDGHDRDAMLAKLVDIVHTMLLRSPDIPEGLGQPARRFSRSGGARSEWGWQPDYRRHSRRFSGSGVSRAADEPGGRTMLAMTPDRQRPVPVGSSQRRFSAPGRGQETPAGHQSGCKRFSAPGGLPAGGSQTSVSMSASADASEKGRPARQSAFTAPRIEAAALLAANPPSSASWDWPMSRPEKLARVRMIDRQMNLMDRQALENEVEELRG
mmetsp:Transcript_21541/g.38008  ORF Transcript_21541/g.38008 Transcript_21541/m.38008 type:complete len:500 (+) Transcript_21541:52-1551(+)